MQAAPATGIKFWRAGPGWANFPRPAQHSDPIAGETARDHPPFEAAIPGWATYHLHLPPPVERQRAGLFDWALRETSPDALFIVPPGMHDFRLFARRRIIIRRCRP